MLILPGRNHQVLRCTRKSCNGFGGLNGTNVSLACLHFATFPQAGTPLLRAPSLQNGPKTANFTEYQKIMRKFRFLI
jgi:hypothetical protein